MVKHRLLILVFAGVLIGAIQDHNHNLSTLAIHKVEFQNYPILTLGDNSPAVMTLHEMLAQLGYLPIEFHSFSMAEQVSLAHLDAPCAGIWTWRSHTPQKELVELWDPTQYSMITKGAVMTFQKEHQLSIDGFAGPKVFRALQLAQMTNMVCQHPYTHVLVKQSIPQTLTVWQEGKVVLKSPCSTGVPQAPTHVGTHVIYLRNIKQKMEGDTPWGKHYLVENVPFVSFFFNGEAIHGLKRQMYGISQSVGCVELPIDNAKRTWELTDYGTLVTVLNP